MTRIDGKVAVVTGAGSGIGRALAFELARRGCRLALTDVHAERLDDTALRCSQIGAETATAVVDAADGEAVAAHAGEVVDRFGQVHLVFNNAGIALIGDAGVQRLEDVQRVIDVNLWGVIHGSRAFLPHLIASGDGHLVNMSSLFGLLAIPKQSAYHASKFAVRGYTEALAVELAASQRPVRASCVHPGGIATRIVEDARFTHDHDRAGVLLLFAEAARTTPLQAARTILRGVERDRPRILVGIDARILDVLVRVLGPRYLGLVSRLARRVMPRAGIPPSPPPQPTGPSSGDTPTANSISAADVSSRSISS